VVTVVVITVVVIGTHCLHDIWQYFWTSG
jgi:hypothetical protein